MAMSIQRGSTVTGISPEWYRRRISFLSYLPTPVRAMLSTIAHRSGNHHRCTRSSSQAFRSSARAAEPGRKVTNANGRSSQRVSGTPITAASTTSGWLTRVVSRCTELIHSPPDLITSLARSVSVRYPSALICPMSPVWSQSCPSGSAEKLFGVDSAVIAAGDPGATHL